MGKKLLALFLAATMVLSMSVASFAAATASATAADVTVAGTKNTALGSAYDVVLTLEAGSDGLVQASLGDNVASWITNLPAGLTAVLKANVTDGATNATITIAGIPTAALEAPMTIVIPSTALTNGTTAVPVTANANVKFAITDGTGSGGSDASAGGQLGGDGTVNKVTYKVTVPSNIDFAIDPFETEETPAATGQLSGTSYVFINKTEAPIKLTLDFTADLTGGDDDAELVADPSTLSPDDDTVTDKKLYMAVIGAKTISDNTGATVAFDTDLTQAKTVVPFDAATGKAEMDFALKASPDGTAAVTGDDGVAAFTYYGVLNSYAAWKDNDVVVTADYDFKALRPATYTTAADAAVGVNQYPVVSAVGWEGKTAGTLDYGTLTADFTTYAEDGADEGNDYALPFNFPAGVELDDITAVAYGGSTFTDQTTNKTNFFNIVGDKLVVLSAKIGAFADASSRYISFEYEGDTYKITLVCDVDA